ncbi:hypothetical protein [Leptolyngbya sp. O-77]|uniref:hypothetical protein n=1 Tax=Leptolyngbya sp. O-77 TaxID=1080068 RepID=UPI0025708E74|nr:hypothetical protein [Leptolyngbya sp. O-77]
MAAPAFRLAAEPVSQPLFSRPRSFCLARKHRAYPPVRLEPGGETRNLLDVAYLLVKSAAFRTESRGGHYRSDYPHSDNVDWQAHTLIQAERWWKSPVGP